jgi:tight adherence protein B
VKELLLLSSLFMFVFCLVCFTLNINLIQNKKIKNKISFGEFLVKKKKILVLFAVFVTSFAVLRNIIFSVIVCILYAYFNWHINYMKQQKISNLADLQILEALTIIKNSLQSGCAITNAIVDVKNELKDPIRSEFEQISKSLSLGLSFEEAIEQASSKTNNKEFKFILNTVKISKDTGASLKGIFDQIIELISKRTATKSKINALTSQGKLSGNIVSLVPFIIIFMMYLIEPDMMQPLFVTLAGNILFLIVVIMVVLGSLIVRKMTEITF